MLQLHSQQFSGHWGIGVKSRFWSRSATIPLDTVRACTGTGCGGIRLTAVAALAVLAFSPAAAQDQSLPPTTLGCENFKKNPDGAWVVVSEKPFQIGSTVVSINTGTMIRPKSVTLVGADIYSLLETKCRGSGNPG